MANIEICSISGSAIPLPGDDIDTDQIIPARFLKEITFDNMGEYLFYDARFNQDGSEKSHILNDPHSRQSPILIVGNNFGCGSSREHAPQAIKRYGINAIIGQSFAEIFSGNCKALGIPNCIVEKETITYLQETVTKDPSTSITIDLKAKQLIINGSEKIAFDIDEAKRQSLLSGSWNAAGLLNANRDKILETASRLPYMNGFD